MHNNKLFLIESLNIVPRVLGLLNRDPDSGTYGCADRNYWHYLIHDMANARLQDVAWLLALVCNLNHGDNRYYDNTQIFEWAWAGILFWAKTVHKNGAVDEVYPYEYSYCATAFSTWWICEAYMELKKNTGKPHKKLTRLAQTIQRAGDWLGRNHNLTVANQEAAAIAALKTVSMVLDDKKYEEHAVRKIHKLIKSQHPSGYYPEYGGPDIGYHSLTLSCLATFDHHMQGYLPLTESLTKAVGYLNTNVDENGLYNWKDTSRRTQYLYPFGLAYCRDMGGQSVLDRYKNGLSKDWVIKPAWMDDRYCTFMAVDYLRTFYRLQYHEE